MPLLGFGAEILLELLFELIPMMIELVLEGIGALVTSFSDPQRRRKDLDTVVRARPAQRGPVALWVDAVLVIVSLLAGGWWGARILDTGQGHPPIAMWTMLLTGVVAGVWAGRQVTAAAASVTEEGRARRFPQLERSRWVRLAVLNLAGAGGVAVGYFG